jgi:GNAT superfamily N-acetyltransferase
VPFLAPASPEQLTEILDATHPLWGEGLDRAAYERYNDAQRKTRWGAGHLHRLVLEDGRRWLATAKRYDLRGRLDGREMRMMGIGAVFTPTPLRGRGHAAELVRRMLEQAQGEGVELALLFSEIGTRYYESLGFGSVPLTQLSLGVNALPGPPGIAMRSGEAADLESICEMNRRQTDGVRFAMIRDADYVGFAIAKKRLLAASGTQGRRTVRFFVVEEGGRAVAYLVLLEVGDYWMITECGDRDPSGARVGAMLQSLLADADRRPARIRAWLPPNFLPPQLAVAARELPALTMMVQPIGHAARLAPPLRADDLAWWHADAF